MIADSNNYDPILKDQSNPGNTRAPVKLTVTFPPGAAILDLLKEKYCYYWLRVGDGEEPTNGVCDGAGFKAPFAPLPDY